jgi:ATP-binding cassette subfamily B protein
MTARRRWFVPETVQTSMMDCGPAALTSLLAGFQIRASYGRLREACHTDVDGTSIDALEEVAKALGLDAEQVMIPTEHLFLPEADALPALIVVRLPNGFTHFTILWRVTAGVAQCMDPGVGRRWVSVARLQEELFVHEMPVPAAAFEEWVGSPEFTRPLERRLAELGVTRELVGRLRGAEGWRPAAALDAATRLVASVVAAGGLARGAAAERVLTNLASRALDEPSLIPDACWTGRPAEPDEEGVPRVLLRGAVLIRVAGARARGASAAAPESPLSPELVAALEEPRPQPTRRWLALVGEDGVRAPAALGVLLVAAAAASAIQAILLRGMLDVGRWLGPVEQRIAAVIVLAAFLVAGILFEWPGARAALGLGRRLETRLRLAFLLKMPRIEDAYFHSRATSDMAARCHTIENVRGLPTLAVRFSRGALELVATCAGIAWLDPHAAPLALGVVLASLVLPVVAMPVLFERDLRARVHANAMATFFFDAMRGLAPIRTHGAERSVRREHESLLSEWVRASRAGVRPSIATEALSMILAYGLTIALVVSHLSRAREPGAVLLLLFWALTLPAIGQELALLARQYPAHFNNTLRLLEPLGAREDRTADPAPPPEPAREKRGVAVTWSGVSVVVSGHAVLTDVDLAIAPGEKVAIVGASGSGKSTLVGLLLGWHRPASGSLAVDGAPLDAASLARLRGETAWVDPAVQLWNRSLHQNLAYGARNVPSSLGALLETAELHAVLDSLPEGLGTSLGESGALVSGGEGQRVRFGRALLRKDARLAILDEPFRGLDRETRRALADRARAWWPLATMLFVTHDVTETETFDRVVVVDGGRVVEEGRPSELLARESRYRHMVQTERRVHDELWGSAVWRRVRIEDGRVVEAPSPRDAA